MAAAKYVWIATTSDWATAGNWDQNAVPNQTDNLDELFFSGVSNVSPTINMDRTGDAFFCSQITTMEAFSGNIGSPGNPLEIELLSDDASTTNTSYNFTHRGSGTVYLKASTGAGDLMDVICDAPITMGNGLSMQLDGKFRFVIVKRGNVEIVGNATLWDTIIAGPYANVTIRAHTSDNRNAGNVWVQGGNVNNYRPVRDFVDITGGTLTQYGVLDDADIVNLNAGTFSYQPLAASGNNPSLFAMGGHLDLGSTSEAPEWDHVVLGPTLTVTGAPATAARTKASGPLIDLGLEYP